MSDSSPVRESEKKADGPHENIDLENADHGIVTKSAPLARQLKGRHMQM
jgi:hypothetical protein